MSYLGFYPAKILSYDANARTAQVHIENLTNGAENGITATFAYPVGDDDKDTERQILESADVYVFFEQGEAHAPVIAFYRSHGVGAVVDIRRIRQNNIELLADLQAKIVAPDIQLEGQVKVTGNGTVTGNFMVLNYATCEFPNFLGQSLTIVNGMVVAFTP